MIRKHTRRAAKAAFAISFGVAIILGGFAGTARPAHVAGPQILLATKDFPEDRFLVFATRPRGAQLGAWASEQSAPLADRAELERRLSEVETRFEGAEVPRPEHWGGLRLDPEEVEFWQQGVDRLHDRFRYRRGSRGGWSVERLSP